jgi:hypothetical protein
MVITDHAYHRAKERLGWNAKALERMLKKVRDNGISHSQTKGSLRKWLSGEFRDHKMTDAKIYGKHCFFFYNDKLITVISIPRSLDKFLTK